MKTILFILLVLTFNQVVIGQCLQISVTTQPATCTQNDGQITLNITPGTGGNAQPPFNINLYYVGLTDIQLASYSGVSFTSITFTPGNGSLNVSGGNTFGIPSNDYTAYGSEYKVTVTSSGGGNIVCKNKTLFVTVKQTPDVHAILDDLQPDTGTGNGSISITPAGGVSPYTFAWADGPTTEDRTNLVASDYSVRITDSNGCSADYAVIVEDASLLTLESIDQNSMLYPNPSYNYFVLNVPLSKDEAVIQVLDFHGDVKYTTRSYDDSIKVPIGNLPSGDYIVKAVQGNWSTTRKIHVNK